MPASTARAGRPARPWWVVGMVVVGCGLLLSAASSPGAGPGLATPAVGSPIHLANPAAVYCTDLGYEYADGRCTFPDGQQCSQWEFLEGRCGAAYSFCARQGYAQGTVSDGADPFSAEHAVCLAADGRVVGSVTALSGLAAKAASSGCASPGSGAATPPLEPRDLPAASPAAPGPTVPSSFDWRDNGGNWLTAVKDQGQCGSCWAFAAVGAVEAAFNLDAGNPDLDLDLSEQYLVADCYTGGSCCGGWHSEAFEFARTDGIPDEGCLPYVDGTGCSCGDTACGSDCTYRTGSSCSDRTCASRCGDWAGRIRRIGAWGYVPASRSAIQQQLIDKGPLAVAMHMGGWWSNGVNYCTAGEESQGVNHGVVIVGYSDAGGYWIVRNSWGAAWDDDGYFNVGYGECLIEDHVYYAQVEPPPAPANDAFAAAETLGPLPATSSQETQFATTQAGEPRPCGSIGATVWYRYTPPAAATLVADTNGSDYDTVLAVYRGTSLSSLVDVACDDDGGDATRSRLSFSAAAGTTYWFQAGGFYGLKGALRLNLSGPLPPGQPTGLTAAPGDGQVTLDWSSPAPEGTWPITDYVIRYRPYGTLAWATFPDGASTATTSTVTGLANGTRYTFRVAAGYAAGSGPWSAPVRATPRPRRPGAPTGLAASPDDQQVALGWSAPATEGTSPITDYAIQQRQIGALAWTTFRDGPSAATSATVTGLANGIGYEFRVAAKNAVGRGPFSTPAAATPGLGPPNDMFAAATVISGASGRATGTNEGATVEAGEPTHHSRASESVWWQWSAPTSGTVTFDSFGSGFDTVLSIYTGSTVGALTEAAWDDDSGAGLQSQATFVAAAGTTYRIVVDGYAANTGDITLNWLYGIGGPGGAIPI